MLVCMFIRIYIEHNCWCLLLCIEILVNIEYQGRVPSFNVQSLHNSNKNVIVQLKILYSTLLLNHLWQFHVTKFLRKKRTKLMQQVSTLTLIIHIWKLVFFKENMSAYNSYFHSYTHLEQVIKYGKYRENKKEGNDLSYKYFYILAFYQYPIIDLTLCSSATWFFFLYLYKSNISILVQNQMFKHWRSHRFYKTKNILRDGGGEKNIMLLFCVSSTACQGLHKPSWKEHDLWIMLSKSNIQLSDILCFLLWFIGC